MGVERQRTRREVLRCAIRPRAWHLLGFVALAVVAICDFGPLLGSGVKSFCSAWKLSHTESPVAGQVRRRALVATTSSLRVCSAARSRQASRYGSKPTRCASTRR